MPFTLTFTIPTVRKVSTRAIVDPAQYDVEINTARGFSNPTMSKSKKRTRTVRLQDGVIYDPDQYDTEENVERHILHKDEKSR